MDIKDKHPVVSAEATPLKPIWEALSKKQDKIKNTDEIAEGKNLYFTNQRALDAVKPVLDRVFDAHILKQDQIKNTDEIPEGAKNRYFSEDRTLKAVEHSIGYLEKKISFKQDRISSSDEIPEGKKNKYFNDDQVIKIIAPMLSTLKSEIMKELLKLSDSTHNKIEDKAKSFEPKLKSLNDRIVEATQNKSPVIDLEPLKKDIAQLKAIPQVVPQSESSVLGASRILSIMVGMKDGIPQMQKIEIRGGKIARIFPVGDK